MTRDTSQLAYAYMLVSGRLSDARRLVYTYVYNNPGTTGAEMDRNLLSYGGRGHHHKRLPELERLGVLAEGDARKCRVTGRQAITWYWRDHVPESYEVPRRRTAAVRVVELEGIVARVRALAAQYEAVPATAIVEALGT